MTRAPRQVSADAFLQLLRNKLVAKLEAQGADEPEQPIRLTFGEVEGRLARLHLISSDKRTQFQARLRNFQKHGIPNAADSTRGKAIKYQPGQVVELALALEFAQLGLLPERIGEIFRSDIYPIYMAVRHAAHSLLEFGAFPDEQQRETFQAGEIESMFLYFDPFALEALTDIPKKFGDPVLATFSFGLTDSLREEIVRLTTGVSVDLRRLAIVNVTSLIMGIIIRSNLRNQKSFLKETIDWCDSLGHMYLMEMVERDLKYHCPNAEIKIENYHDVLRAADLLRDVPNVAIIADAYIDLAKKALEQGVDRPKILRIMGNSTSTLGGGDGDR